LRWTSKSVRHLAEGLRDLEHEAHFTKVAQLLRGLGYSLQSNVKTWEGAQHPDRDAQFRYINMVATRAVDRQEPVISVDTKKKELVGDFGGSSVLTVAPAIPTSPARPSSHYPIPTLISSAARRDATYRAEGSPNSRERHAPAAVRRKPAAWCSPSSRARRGSKPASVWVGFIAVKR
jgi:Rhodopirellula transposase DDE domain